MHNIGLYKKIKLKIKMHLKMYFFRHFILILTKYVIYKPLELWVYNRIPGFLKTIAKKNFYTKPLHDEYY